MIHSKYKLFLSKTDSQFQGMEYVFLSLGIRQARVHWYLWCREKDGTSFAGFQGVEI